MKKLLIVSSMLLLAFVAACGNIISKPLGSGNATNAKAPTTTRSANPNAEIDYSKSKLETIYLAGGCFWGVEEYISRIPGVQDVTSGYANGIGENPTYEEVNRGKSQVCRDG